MPGLGLAHHAPSSYRNAEKVSNALKESNGNALHGKVDPHSTRKGNLPKVLSLPSTADVDEVVNALMISGGVVIRNAVSHEDVDIIESEGTMAFSPDFVQKRAC